MPDRSSDLDERREASCGVVVENAIAKKDRKILFWALASGAIVLTLAAYVGLVAVTAQGCMTLTMENAKASCAAAEQSWFIDPFTRTAVLKRLARAQQETGDNEAAIATITRLEAGANAGFYDYSTRGLALYNLGRYSEAAADFKTAHLLRPAELNTLADLIWTLIDDGDLNAAKTFAETYRTTEKEGAHGEYLLGRVLYLQQDYPQALVMLQQAEMADPANATVHNELGLVHEAMGETEKALGSYGKAIAADSTVPRFLANRGILFSDLGKTTEALADLEAATKITRESYYLIEFARILLDAEELTRARLLLLEAESSSGPTAETQVLLGRVAYDEGNYTDARAKFAKAQKLNPDDKLADYWIASVDAVEGKAELALAGFLESEKQWPKSFNVQIDLGHALIDLDRLDEAIAKFRKAAEFDPENSLAHEGLAKALGLQRQWTASRDAAAKAIALNPERALGYFRRAYALWWLDEIDGARVDYDKAVSLAPKSLIYLEERADFYVSTRPQAEAEKAIADLRTADPQSSAAHRFLGRLAEYERDYRAALVEYDKGHALNPSDHWFLEDRAWAEIAANDPVSAIENCNKMLTLMPREPASYRCRARAQWRLDNVDAALADLDEALKLNNTFLPAVFDKGYMSLSARKGDQGVEAFSRTIKENYRLSQSHFYRGLGFEQTEEPLRAIKDFEKALELADSQFAIEVSAQLRRLQAKQPASALPDEMPYPQARGRKPN